MKGITHLTKKRNDEIMITLKLCRQFRFYDAFYAGVCVGEFIPCEETIAYLKKIVRPLVKY